jgi:polyisoprenoid-binding protein YceI
MIRTTLIATALAAGTLPSAAQAQSVTYAIDPTHTFVTFEIGHFGTSTNRGRFDKKKAGAVRQRRAKSGKVDITIETGSINTGTEPFNKHLQSKDFFNSAKFPTAASSADKFSFNGDKVSEVPARSPCWARPTR